jgi:hypothetical protein
VSHNPGLPYRDSCTPALHNPYITPRTDPPKKPALFRPVFLPENPPFQAIRARIRVFRKTSHKNSRNRPVGGIRKKGNGGWNEPGLAFFTKGGDETPCSQNECPPDPSGTPCRISCTHTSHNPSIIPRTDPPKKPALFRPVFLPENTPVRAIRANRRVFRKNPLKNSRNRPVAGIRKKGNGGWNEPGLAFLPPGVRSPLVNNEDPRSRLLTARRYPSWIPLSEPPLPQQGQKHPPLPAAWASRCFGSR